MNGSMASSKFRAIFNQWFGVSNTKVLRYLLVNLIKCKITNKRECLLQLRFSPPACLLASVFTENKIDLNISIF